MTIQPSPTIEWPAEQRPLPDGWCYRCGGEHHPASVRHAIHDSPRPRTIGVTAEFIAARAAQEAPLPMELSDWHAGHVALARAVAVELQLWADTAERLSRL